MTKVTVYVTLRESVVDPQGIAAQNALQAKGFQELTSVRVGKLIELEVDSTTGNLEERVKEMCESILVNQVIEDYRFEIEEVAGQ